MTLEIMAGPINMSLDPEDSGLGGVAGFNDGLQAMWRDDVGWVGRHPLSDMTGCGLSGFVTCNIDGVTRCRNFLPSAFGVQAIQQDDLTNKMIVSYSTSGLYLMNPVVCGLEPDSTINAMQGAAIRTKVGWYKLSGSNIQIAPLDATDNLDFATEYTVTPGWTVSSQFNRISLGPDNLIYCYNGDATNPTIIVYDYVLKTEVYQNPGLGSGRWELDHQVRAVIYSRMLDVFMTYEEDGLTSGQGILYVYSTEMTPSALSAPTDSPAIAAGVVSTLSVALTDDQGVGIRGRLIDWSITAGNGTLLDTQTTTDEDGVATTQYRAEITGGSNPTIQASLTY